MTQVPYDDIRRALLASLEVLANTPMQCSLAVWSDHAGLVQQAAALLADAQRWRMIAEPSGEVVEKVARAIHPFAFTKNGSDSDMKRSFNQARAVLRTLEGLVK